MMCTCMERQREEEGEQAFQSGQWGLVSRTGHLWGGEKAVHLVDVRDEPALARRVDLLIVGPQLALDGEKQNFQVPLLGEPEAGGWVGVRVKGHTGPGTLRFKTRCPVVLFFSSKHTWSQCKSQKIWAKQKERNFTQMGLYQNHG